MDEATISLAEPFNTRLVRDVRQRATIDLFVAAVAAIAVMAVACFSARVFIDGDTNWHVASGRWIIQHATVPLTDPFSFTYAGKPWIAHEWGSEVLMAGAYLIAGWSGVVVLIGLAAGLSFWLMARELALWMGPIGQAIGLALAFTCLQPFLFARPHILAMPLLVFWTSRILAARRNRRAPPLELAPLMVVWANLHASFIFGLGVIGPFALEALIEEPDKLRVIRGWGLFGVVSAAFALVTPHGIAGIEFPFMVMGMKTLVDILEWHGQSFQSVTPFEASVLITLFFGLWRGVKVPLLRLILLIVLVHMSLQHVRQQAVLAALAPLILAEPFGRALKPAREGPRIAVPAGWKPTWRVPSVTVATVLGLAALGVIGARLANPLVRRDNVNVPVSAVAHVPPELLSQPVINEYAFGGYLIFKGVKPYIDGRADMYGDAFVAEYLAIVSGAEPDADNAIKRWNIKWTILAPRDGLVAKLDHTPGWTRVYSDVFAVVQARTDALKHPPPPSLEVPQAPASNSPAANTPANGAR